MNNIKGVGIKMLKKMIKAAKYFLFIKANIKIGSGTRVLTRFSNFGSEPYLVEIGDNCLITSGVKFLTHDTSVEVALRKYENQKTLENGYFDKTLFGKIIIRDNCFIGVNSIVLPGVTIGPNSIVAAGSVVTKDVLPDMVYGGNPARKICTIEEYYDKNKDKLTIINSSNNLHERKVEILSKLKVPLF